MTRFQFTRYRFFITFLSLFLISLHMNASGEPLVGRDSSGADPALGHLQCIIKADTNCLDHTVTLEAWHFYLFTGVLEPVTADWSTGVQAHKITVEPPGAWSWTISPMVCDHFFNFITLPAFFQDTIDITGPDVLCSDQNAVLTVNTQGYTGFNQFQWTPDNFQAPNPHPISYPGKYVLTVKDALGCSFSDSIQIDQLISNESCYDGCQVCDLDGYSGTNSGSVSIGNTVCGSIVVHNARWVGFIAGTSTIGLYVATSNCQNGDGLQLAIFDDCNDPDALVCNAGCGGCGNVTMTIEYSGFTPGETYWLMVDGYIGDVCDFTVDVVAGSTGGPAVADPAVPSGPVVVCPGGAVVYTIPDVTGAGFYHWTAPPGASINGGLNDVLIDAPEGSQVTVTFGNESGLLSVHAGNSCHPPSDTAVLPVLVQSSNPVTTRRDSLVVCYQPYTWDLPPYTLLTTIGVYELMSETLQSVSGCDSFVVQTVTILPAIETVLPPETKCAADCPGCQPGFSQTVYTSYLGCDSIVTATLTLLYPVAQITGLPEINCLQTSATLFAASTPGDILWLDAAGLTVGSGSSFVTDLPGTYTLSVTVEENGVTCLQTAETTVALALQPPAISVDGTENGCQMDPLILACAGAPDGSQYHWNGPGGFESDEAAPAVQSSGMYTVTVTTPGNCTAVATGTVTQIGGPPDIHTVSDTITCFDPVADLYGYSATAGATFSWTDVQGNTYSGAHPVISMEGAYLLTVTGPNGCTASEYAYLSTDVNAPLVNLPETVQIICTNYPWVSFSTNVGSVPCQWSGPDGFSSELPELFLTAAGLYTVVVTDLSNGCTASDHLQVVDLSPELSITTDAVFPPSMGINNGSIFISLTSTPVLPGQFFNILWVDEAGNHIAVTEDLTGVGPGVYTVFWVDNFGCSVFRTFQLEAISATDEAESGQGHWTVSPNPSGGKFQLYCSEPRLTILGYDVYDQTGRRIMANQNPMGGVNPFVDLTGAPNGIYWLCVRDPNGCSRMKLVLLH